MMAKFSLFEATGVELEYMIVDRDTLAVAPISDRLLHQVTGTYSGDAVRGEVGWSNELVLHVIELKTNEPALTLDGWGEKFQESVREINSLLRSMNAMLMPTAMHPTMDPHRETKLWPHEYSAVYHAYDRIFNCQGHGWSNVQSTHINLPFANDEEFGRLHAAIRLVLPLLPALSASSPIVEGRRSGFADTRLDYYQRNQARVPSIIGSVIPEPVFTRADYEKEILQRAYNEIAPYDTESVLQDEFLNSRGAIARFGRGSIEIRLLDIQECPAADLAIVELVIALLKAHVEERFLPYEEQKKMPTEALRTIFLDCVRDGEKANLHHTAFLRMFDLHEHHGVYAREIWMSIVDALGIDWRVPTSKSPLGAILQRGTLSTRILRALGDPYDPAHIPEVYRELCDCLEEGRQFGI